MVDAMLKLRPDLRIDRLVASACPPSRDSRLVLHEWDPSTPPEQLDGLIRNIDASHPAPLDGGLLFGSEQSLAHSLRKLGLRPVIGFDVSGKPWSHSFTSPQTRQDWIDIVDDMAWVPEKFRK